MPNALGGRACQVIFLVGADDSSIPQVTPGLGLLTDHDREILEGYGLELAPRTEEKLSREYTIVYTTCAQPPKSSMSPGLRKARRAARSAPLF